MIDFAVVGDRDLRPLSAGFIQAAGELLGHQRCVTWDRQHKFGGRRAHACGDSGQGAEEFVCPVRDDRQAEFRVSIQAAVGIDDDLSDLWSQSLQHVPDHGAIADLHEPLVDASHTQRPAAGENDAGDFGARISAL